MSNESNVEPAIRYYPTAAERYDGGKPCDYPECDNTADWLVEINQDGIVYCCDSCGSANRLHPYDVEEYEVTVDE